jgi:predicted extracellular nuclease
MTKPLAKITFPGQQTVLAALLGGLCAPAFADSPVVISQVYGGNGGTYKNDYVELFNRSSGPVEIGGWSVQYAATGGVNWSKLSLPSSVSLAAGQYYLIQMSSAAATGAELPAPFHSGTLINMAGGSGKVALMTNSDTVAVGVSKPSANLADFVGYGPGTNASEISPTSPVLTTTTAALRKANGCTDSDNNLADFTNGAPAPRNSNTVAACAGSGGGGTPVAKPIVPSCPSAMSFSIGTGGVASLSATDPDGIVNNIAITSGMTPGISLSQIVLANAAGGTATANLRADASVANGSYPIGITFTSGPDNESISCTVNVRGASAHTIAQIQGTGASSPFVDTVQITEGVITKIISNGFFIQDTSNSGDAGASRGLFVFGVTPAAAVGDLVRVTGTIAEFFPVVSGRSYTEMKNVTDPIVVLSSGNTVTPTNLSLPMADLANYDSMLVQLTNTMVINATTSLTTFGELSLGTTRHEVPTNRFPKGADADALAAANAADTLVLSSVSGVKPTVSTIPYFDYDVGTRRVGDQVSNLVGVLDFGSIGAGKAAFKLQPVLMPTVSSSNARTAGPDVPVGNLKVASANVLNYFTTFTNGTDANGNTGKVCTIGGSPASASECRGANTKAEFDRQSAKIVNELAAMNADVVGLMEIQNNLDNALADVSVAYLVGQLNAKVGFGTYTYVGGALKRGTDAIRVAMIYKPAVVSPVGAPIEDDDPDGVNNRGPLAQTFKAANGAKFSVVVNHLKSKSTSGCPSSGADADANDSQGCFNAARIKQAQHLAGAFLPAVVTKSGDPDVLLIGDFNSHGFEDPINVLTAAGLVNELERFVRPTGMVYSYVFDGESGYLDHALATPALNGQVAGATEWHNNADEPTFIDYNSGAFSTLYKDNAYRASDHDPVVISLNLAPTFIDVTPSFTVARSGFTVNRATNQFNGSITITNKTGNTINGPINIEMSGLPAGVTLLNASMHNGVPYLTVNGGAGIAPNASLTTTTSFANPNKAVIGYTATITSGNY